MAKLIWLKGKKGGKWHEAYDFQSLWRVYLLDTFPCTFAVLFTCILCAEIC